MIDINEKGTYITTLTEEENINLENLFCELSLAQTGIDTYAELIQVSKRARATLLSFIYKCNEGRQEDVEWEEAEAIHNAVFNGTDWNSATEDDYVAENEHILKEIAQMVTFKNCMEV